MDQFFEQNMPELSQMNDNIENKGSGFNSLSWFIINLNFCDSYRLTRHIAYWRRGIKYRLTSTKYFENSASAMNNYRVISGFSRYIGYHLSFGGSEQNFKDF